MSGQSPSQFLEEVREVSRMNALREAEEQAKAVRQSEIGSDDCLMAGELIGHLSDLPLWAQAYIKSLRRGSK